MQIGPCKPFFTHRIFHLLSKFFTLLSNPKCFFRFDCAKSPKIKILLCNQALASLFSVHRIFDLLSKFLTLLSNPKCFFQFNCAESPKIKILLCKQALQSTQILLKETYALAYRISSGYCSENYVRLSASARRLKQETANMQP